jgi:hypothetical protein
MYQIFKNTDTKFTITLKMNGVAVDLNTLTGYAVWITYTDGSDFMKFSRNSLSVDNVDMIASGFKTLKVVDAKKGQFKIVINAADTISKKVGRLNMDIKIQYNDADVLTGIFHSTGETKRSFAEFKDNPMQTTNNL